MAAKRYRAIGLMSGTSIDGVDAAYIETDGVDVFKWEPGLLRPYDEATRQQLHKAIKSPNQVDSLLLEKYITDCHIEAVQGLLKQLKLNASDIDIIGFPGQTISHRPAEGLTWQIGNAAQLAHAVGINVIGDFRRCDMAAGGQGAPLVPVYHAALCKDLGENRVAVVNIGGVANVTFCDFTAKEEMIIAFDTGPGNAPIDDLMHKHKGVRFDRNGEVAAQGQVHNGLLEVALEHPYFKQPFPKSLDRQTFIMDELFKEIPFEDAVATVTAFTAIAISKAQELLMHKPQRWLICGGGRHNQTLLNHLCRIMKYPVEPCESVGWDGDMLEAQAFAFLAVRCLEGLPITYSTTTGADSSAPMGALYRCRLR